MGFCEQGSEFSNSLKAEILLSDWTTVGLIGIRLHAVRSYISQHELANKRTFTAIPRQQTNRTQGNTATHLDIRDRALGMQQAIQHQDPPNIPVKIAQNDQQCPLVRLQPNLAQ